MKRVRILLGSALWAGMLIVIFSGAGFSGAQTNQITKDQKEDLYKNVEVFADALSIVSADYVDQVNSKDLIYGALEGMLASLDPHSQFLDPDAYKEIKIDTKGEFGGLGIEITLRDDLLTVIAPIDGTPAERAGIEAGDRIVKIDGQTTRDITLHEAVKRLRGDPGTSVALTILREGENRIFDVTIIRALIQVKSIKKAKLIDGSIGYVKLAEFQEHTPADLDRALTELSKEGMDSLILDLRNNPGGLLNVSVEVAGAFLKPGLEIVSTRGRLQAQNVVYKNHAKNGITDLPVIVLVNGGSASASEIVAGALKDHKRALILGTKTFGKGSVQTIIPLKDGSALRLTTAKYFTPSGASIHNEGIVPDVIVEQVRMNTAKKRHTAEVFERLDREEPGQEVQEEGDAVPPTKDELTEEERERSDAQLLRAIDLMKGIKALGLLVSPASAAGAPGQTVQQEKGAVGPSGAPEKDGKKPRPGKKKR